MMKVLCAAISVLLVLAACNAGDVRQPAPDGMPATMTTTAASAAPVTPAADAVHPAFNVDVKLTPAAASKLTSTNETIIVAADYSGIPAGIGGSPADPNGTVQLGRETVEMFGAGRAVFSTANADPTRRHLIEKGEVRLLINVYSGRRSSEDNVIDCGIFDDLLTLATQKTIEINCSLIGEDSPPAR